LCEKNSYIASLFPSPLVSPERVWERDYYIPGTDLAAMKLNLDCLEEEKITNAPHHTYSRTALF